VDKAVPKKGKIFYGWWIVLICAFLNFFGGGTFFYGFTTFFNPIRVTFGWTAAVTSIAFALQRLEQGILGPVAGFLVDRIGPRKLLLTGWGVVGAGNLLMSRISSLWEFYAAFLIIAMGFSLASFVVLNAVIANWFTKKRSRALSLAYIGPGASGLLVPLLALSISEFDWRTTLVIVGILSWFIGLPLSALMRHRPEQYGFLPDGEAPAPTSESTSSPISPSTMEPVEQDSGNSATGFTAKEAIKTKTFWLLSLVFLFQHIGMSAVMVHIVPYLESVNVPTTIAAMAVTGMTLFSLIGRLGFGFLGDFTNKRYLIAISLVLQTIGIFLFSLVDMNRVWLVFIFLLTYGPGYGGPIPLRGAVQADYFGTRNFGTILGLMALISIPGGLLSPIIAGWIFDVTGSYHLAWQIFALITLPAIPLMLLAKSPKANPEPPHLTISDNTSGNQ